MLCGLVENELTAKILEASIPERMGQWLMRFCKCFLKS